MIRVLIARLRKRSRRSFQTPAYTERDARLVPWPQVEYYAFDRPVRELKLLHELSDHLRADAVALEQMVADSGLSLDELVVVHRDGIRELVTRDEYRRRYA